MKFRGNFIKSTLLSLAAVVALGGCNAGGVSSSGGVSSTVPSVTATTAATTAPSLDLPDPVTGTYNGNAVTMRYTAMTDLNIDIAYCQPFQSGFAIVMNDPETGITPEYAYIDEDGNVLGNTWYQYADPFDEDGRALVKQSDNSWTWIDKTGTIVAQAPEREPSSHLDMSMYYEENGLWGLQEADGTRLTEPVFVNVEGFSSKASLAYATMEDHGEYKNVMIDRTGKVCMTLPEGCNKAYDFSNDLVMCLFIDEKDFSNTRYQLYKKSGTPLNERRFKAIGNFVDGLAPVMEDGKLGLMDEAGQMVIEPSLPLDDHYQVNLQWGENRIVVARDGKLAIVEVTFS